MASSLQFSFKSVVTASGRSRTYEPSIAIPGIYIAGDPFLYQAVTIPHLPAVGDPIPQPFTVWDQTVCETFSLLILQWRGGTGFGNVLWLTDKPVSGTDTAPTGTRRFVHNRGLAGHAPMVFDSPWSRGHASVSTQYGLDGDGFPLLATDAASEDHRVYGIWCQNRSYTDDAVLEYWIFA
jgi:hypothetical protein